MVYQIDCLAYQNKLRSIRAEYKLGFAFLLFILSYLAPAVVQILISLWLMVWIVVYAGIPLIVYRRLLILPLSFWCASIPALIFGINFDSIDRSLKADIAWNLQLGQIGIYISHKGLEQAITILTRTVSLTSCMFFILLTVPWSEVVRVLQKYGCPSLLCELLLLMYRFIFILTQTATELLTAQKSRLGFRTYKTTIKSISIIIAQLLQRSIENYREISLGLASRGFTGELKIWHSYSSSSKVNWRYLIEAIAGYCLLLILTFIC